MFVVLLSIYMIYLVMSYEHSEPIEFETVSDLNVTNDQYILFHWKTTDELVAGQPISVSVRVQGLPYSSLDGLKPIQIRFDGTGYYADYTHNIIKNDSANAMVTLTKFGQFKESLESDPTIITYTTGGKWSVYFCDQNLKNKFCVTVPNIVEIAPRSTLIQLQDSRTSDNVAKGIFALSIILVWLTMNLVYKESGKEDDADKVKIDINQETQTVDNNTELQNLKIQLEIESLKVDLANLKTDLANQKLDQQKKNNRKRVR